MNKKQIVASAIVGAGMVLGVQAMTPVSIAGTVSKGDREGMVKIATDSGKPIEVNASAVLKQYRDLEKMRTAKETQCESLLSQMDSNLSRMDSVVQQAKLLGVTVLEPVGDPTNK